jgi:nicotinamidase-related amidase
MCRFVTFAIRRHPTFAGGNMTPSPTIHSERKAMPLTKLDDTPALVVIDLQKGIVRNSTMHPATEIIDRAAQLVRAFRERSLPVVLVNVASPAPGRTDAGPSKFSFPPDWTDLVPQLDPQPTDHLITKKSWGAFLTTSLHDDLRRRRVTQIVLTGISTSLGVESTARSAYDLGYNVALVVDAMTDRDPDAHRNSIEKIFPRLGETTRTADLLNLLQKAAAR